MKHIAIEQPMLELVAVDARRKPLSQWNGSKDHSGKMRFDGLPPGRYVIRLGEEYRGFHAGQVLSEVEVTAGATTEVFLRLTQGCA